MEFTGERYVPSETGQIKYEHIHRYALASSLVAGKSVLDIACGEGYGSAILAQQAASVVGVDIDPATVALAQRHYQAITNLSFREGSCDAMGLSDHSVEVVVSFETLEHHDKHEEMMLEIKRVLKPGGLLIISSPNKLTYSDEPNYTNPYHVKELYYDQLTALLSRHFRHQRLYGQKITGASFLYSLDENDTDYYRAFREPSTSDSQPGAEEGTVSLEKPIYFLAFCSDEALTIPALDSIFINAADEVGQEQTQANRDKDQYIRRLEQEYQQQTQHISQLEAEQQRLSQMVQEKDAHQQSLETQLRNLETQLQSLETYRQNLEAQYQQKLHQIEEQTQYQQKLEGALAGHQAQLEQQERMLSRLEVERRRQSELLQDKTQKLRESQQKQHTYEQYIGSLEAERHSLHLQLQAQNVRNAELAQHLEWLQTEASVRQQRLERYSSDLEALQWTKTVRTTRTIGLMASWAKQIVTAPVQPAIQGNLDSPQPEQTLNGALHMWGWTVSSRSPVSRVEVWLDGQLLGTAGYGQLRSDVLQRYPLQLIGECGYAASFALDPAQWSDGPKTLEVLVRDRRGNTRSFTCPVVLQLERPAAVPIAALPEPPPTVVLPAPGQQEGTAGAVHFTDEEYKHKLTELYLSMLNAFLASGTRLKIPTSRKPLVSILMVLYNRAELTFQCLRSISQNYSEPLELIIVDNASTDDTDLLLERIDGAHIIRNKQNYQFLLASNQAARLAKSKYLLFLNNDTQVLPGSISAALHTIESEADIGAVGGKLILLDGRLQEAGSVIWQEGSCQGYGRGDDSLAPPYNFVREVDYCSGAFLLTSRELFTRLGFFDEAYTPAYYEETDYCLKVWQSGLRVIYEPRAAVLHYEFGSSQASANAVELQIAHRQVLLDKHGAWLRDHHLEPNGSMLLARQTCRNRPRLLMIDDRVPHQFFGSGSPRTREMLASLVELDCQVTFYPMQGSTELLSKETWDNIYNSVPRTVEVMADYGSPRLAAFLHERQGYYDTIIVSRPHNMEFFQSLVAADPDLLSGVNLVYDAEALYSMREVAYRRLIGKELTEEETTHLIDAEIGLIGHSTTVLCVSRAERDLFAARCFSQVEVLSHTVTPDPTPALFESRSGVLFVGPVFVEESPNADAILWFGEQVWPQLSQELGSEALFTVAGEIRSVQIEQLASDNLRLIGKVADLSDLYNTARIFVAPTRYSAGVPLKIYEAAARGVPVVASPLLAQQLGWQDGVELLVAESPAEFAEKCALLYRDPHLWQTLRHKALQRVAKDCSREFFKEQLRKAISSTALLPTAAFDADEKSQ